MKNTKKYFYSDGKDKFGPFSKDELKELFSSRDTLIWYYGLEDWVPLSQIDELKEIYYSIPPDFFPVQMRKVKQTPDSPQRSIKETEQKNISNNEKTELVNENLQINKSKHNYRFVIILGGFIVIVLAVIFSLRQSMIPFSEEISKENRDLHNEIASNSYISPIVDLNIYLEKFYRDINYHGIYPTKPKSLILKFSSLDKMKTTTHAHGLSFGYNNDQLIEIYINPSSWSSLTKPMKYYVLYHELGHDVLNLKDLEENENNIGKIMYPNMSINQRLTMDDFIKNSKELFKEIKVKSKMQ